jgi:hypothetical protein
VSELGSDAVFVHTAAEALRHVEAELRARYVKQRSTGLILLPMRDPKPVPPPEFWTQDADTMSVPLETTAHRAARRLRAIMRAKRYGAPIPPEEGA